MIAIFVANEVLGICLTRNSLRYPQTAALKHLAEHVAN